MGADAFDDELHMGKKGVESQNGESERRRN
jgi:hypothetical protein